MVLARCLIVYSDSLSASFTASKTSEWLADSLPIWLSVIILSFLIYGFGGDGDNDEPCENSYGPPGDKVLEPVPDPCVMPIRRTASNCLSARSSAVFMMDRLGPSILSSFFLTSRCCVGAFLTGLGKRLSVPI
jgi:hypothetical protein